MTCCGNLNKKPVGRCSQCGGVVSLPIFWMGVNRPVPTCETCGGIANPAHNLPVIPITPVGCQRGTE